MKGESALVTRILLALRKQGATAIKIHGSVYSRKGEPDIIGCYQGMSFAMEVKLDYNKPTIIQQVRLREWLKSGARTAVVRSVDEAVRAAIKGEEVNHHEFEIQK